MPDQPKKPGKPEGNDGWCIVMGHKDDTGIFAIRGQIRAAEQFAGDNAAGGKVSAVQLRFQFLQELFFLFLCDAHRVTAVPFPIQSGYQLVHHHCL